jgi:hypothetical protein
MPVHKYHKISDWLKTMPQNVVLWAYDDWSVDSFACLFCGRIHKLFTLFTEQFYLQSVQLTTKEKLLNLRIGWKFC